MNIPQEGSTKPPFMSLRTHENLKKEPEIARHTHSYNKKKRWQHQMLARKRKNWNSHILWETIWQFLKKLNMQLHCDSTLKYLPQRNENLCLYKVLYETVLSPFLIAKN